MIALRFADDPNTTEQLTDVAPQENNRLLITFRNFNTALGIGNIDPIRIGTFDGRPTYLRYTVHTIGESRSRLMTITIFIGPA